MELAERHGWTGDPAAGIACMVVGLVLVRQGQPDEADPWVQRAERTLTADTQPAAVLSIRIIRGSLELERDRNAAALAVLEAGEALARRLAGPNYFVAWLRALLVHALIRLGQAERAGQFLAGLGEQDRDRGELRVAAAELRLAQGDPRAALAALAPIQPGPDAEDYWRTWRGRADVLEAIARDALGDLDAADAALERALDLSERRGYLTAFLLYPAAGLLERHDRHRTAHDRHGVSGVGIADGRGGRGPRPWPSVQSRRFPAPFPGPDFRPLCVRGRRNTTVYGATR